MNIEMRLEGFTPLIDSMIDEYGLVTAAVYGIVWRHCQMKDKVCKAAIITIAKKINVSERTVIRHLQKLCSDGYLEDRTPDLKHKPHTYAITGKIYLCGVISAEAGMTESQTLTDRYDRESDPGMTESQLKILHEDTNNNIAGKKPASKRSGEKPKTRLMNKFVTKTGLPIPNNSSDKSFWWSKIGVIYQAVDKDTDLGERLIDEAIEQLRRANMSISNPGSLVKTVYALIEKSNRTNGKHIDESQYVEVKDKKPETVDLAVDEDWLTENLAKVREGLTNGN